MGKRERQTDRLRETDTGRRERVSECAMVKLSRKQETSMFLKKFLTLATC